MGGVGLVTCIMPTAGRPAFALQAVRYFLRQTFSDAELVVVDDGTEPLDLPQHPRVRYIRLDRKRTVGHKRNIACEAARGTLIAHWDDDDWYPADRLAVQVAAMTDGVDLCGVDTMLYLDLRDGRAWRYQHPGGRPWLSGLCYRKSFWARNPFPHVQQGSDTRFLWAGDATRYRTVSRTLQVCTLHGDNVSPKDPRSWLPAAPSEVRELVRGDWAFYQRHFASVRTRVGILTSPVQNKGLWRDAESLKWALGDRATVSVFAPDVLQGAATTWLDTLDVLVVCEVLRPDLFDVATARGVRVVYITNLDWAQLDGEVAPWIAALQSRPHVAVWAKTARAVARLDEVGIAAKAIPWSIPDPVRVEPAPRAAGPIRFYMNAGTGGWRGRRGVDIALKAFARARAQVEMTLTLKLVRPLEQVAGGEPLDGVTVLTETLDREALRRQLDAADAVLHPSRWEGLGLPVLEALHRGLPVLTTDGWPMNELVESGHTGLLVPAVQRGETRLAPHWEVDVNALADAMVRLAREPRLLARMTCPEPGAWQARQVAFQRFVRRQLVGDTDPTIVSSGARSRAETSVRINLGCGDDIRPGYINVDHRAIEGVDVIADLTQPLPFADGRADEVLALDILEHFPRALLRSHVLPEVRRILRDGGRLVARLPDLERIMEDWRRGTADAETTALRIHGRQDYPGNTHYWSYTPETFTAELRAAGFTGVHQTGSVQWNMAFEAVAGAQDATWDSRARQRGELGVVPRTWSATRYHHETQRWWQMAYAVLRRTCRRGRVLDYGCGTGRFATLMRQSGYQVDAVDRSPEMLRLARDRDADVAWHYLNGAGLPFPDGAFDVVWTCTVLQHLPEHEFHRTTRDLYRVLRPGGTWLAFENTHQHAARASHSGHVVFRTAKEYLAALPGAVVVQHMVIDGERHTLFGGTRRG